VNFPSQLVLSARGFTLASITEVSPVNQAGLILQDSLRLVGWPGIEAKDYVPDQVWRTLIADRDFEGQVPPTWYQRVCLRCLEMTDTFNNGDLNIGQLLHQASEMIRIYLTRVRSITWNRRFFKATTKEGEATVMGEDGEKAATKKEGRKPVVGLCPRQTKAGDLVCILFGCSVPVILRPANEEGTSYKLIGECYVHGKMDGEAMTDLDDEKTLSGRMDFSLE
jgi:hypothetical protein